MPLNHSYKKPEYREKMRQIKFRNKENYIKGIMVRFDGYIDEYCPNHPFNHRGYVLQHRLVMEKYIKRFLLPNEIVHHINENRGDNRIENLQLLQNLGEHNTIHKTKSLGAIQEQGEQHV